MNTICMLVNNLDFFRIDVKNWPKEISDDYVIIFTDTRLADITKEIKEILDDFDNKLSYKIVTTEMIHNKLSESFELSEFCKKYTMSLKILMPWFTFKYFKKADGCFFLDEDIILNEGINKLFDGNDKFYVDKMARFSQKHIFENNNKKVIALWQELLDCFKTNKTPEETISMYTNAGHKLLYKKNFKLELYEEALHIFFESKNFEQIWDKRKSYRTQALDEKFDNAYLTAVGIKNDKMYENRNVLFLNYGKGLTDSTLIKSKQYQIVHICNGKYKNETYQRMIDLEVLKDV